MNFKPRFAMLALFGAMVSAAWAFKSVDQLTDPKGLPARAIASATARALQADQIQADEAAAQAGVAVAWHDILATPTSVRGTDLSVLSSATGLTKGMVPARQGDFAADAVTVLDNVAGLFRIKAADQEFALVRDDADGLGHHHVRLEQFFDGLRVVGGELIVHFDAARRSYEVNGRYVADIAVDTMPAILAATAELTARKDQIARNLPAGKLLAEPELVVYAWDSDPRLAWELVLWYSDKAAGSGRWRYWIDALDSSIIRVYNDIHRIAGPTANGANTTISGTYLAGEAGGTTNLTGWRENNGVHYLYSKVNFWYVYNVASSGYSDNNTYAYRNNTANWSTTDRAEMSLAKNFTWAQKYFKNVHGRNSYNNGNAYARANVHEGNSYVNAYWDGSDFHFGDGDNVQATSLGTTDIAGHEFTHAVTEYSANLYYYGESGALNESFSDIFGTCIEIYSQPNGRGLYPNKQAGYSDWLCGEDAWLSDKALRDMRNPANTVTVGAGNQQPSRYKGTYWYFGTEDNAGVHQNSGVQNFFFYLLSQGGSGSNDGISYNVTGIGVGNAERVAYRALTAYCGVNTDHTAARGCWVSAAQDLNAAWVSSVEAAWAAVGIGTAQQGVATPVITPAGGAYEGSVTARVTCATAGAAIRYTTNGSEPTESSSLYLNPIVITSDTTLKAKGFKSGLAASATASATYTFLGTRIFNFPLTTNPGWTTSGQWAYGVPTGGGGEHGSPDPSAGYTGTKVYGYNLIGDYANNIASTYWLKTPALDLSNVSNVRLAFKRWLGVERPAYDHAYVQVSNDGSSWTTVWQNEAEVADAAWVSQVLDISSVADLRATVYIRWGMGPTDTSWVYCGWNIDDIEIWGLQGTATLPPASPTNLTASALSSTNVQLNWQDRSNNEQGFSIERRDAGVWGPLANVGANVTVYDDDTVVGGTSYTYRVRAYNAVTNSEYSNESTVNTPSGDGDVWDPADDTGAGATQLNTPTDVEQSHGQHALSATDLYDWFKVNLTAGTTYNFNSGGGSGDTYGELFSDQGGATLVAVDDDSGGNRQFSLTYTPPVSGWYYLSVSSYYLGEDASYALKYRRTAGDTWTLGDALNAPARAWYTGGDAVFYGQTAQAHDGIAAVKSGAITHNQYSWLGTVVTGPGIARFWWKSSSETDYDYLYFYMEDDAAIRMWLSGQTGWQRRSFVVPAGSHMFYWGYSKDGSFSEGSDAGWIDQFTFTARNRSVVNDYDNDDRSDLAVYDKASAKWYIYSTGQSVSLAYGKVWGASSMTPYPGDYNGDGRADMAVYNPFNGAWYIKSITGATLANGVLWGFSAGTPVPGDYNGDGATDLAIYNAATGRWYIRTLSGRTLAWGLNWGFSGCVAVPGDYDGDGKSDLAVYNTSTGAWFIRSLAGATIAWNTSWGFYGAIPVPGDYNGDGRGDLAVYESATMTWFIQTLYGEILADAYSWGIAGSTPLAGDFDGDGADDMAIYSAGRWYVYSLVTQAAVLNNQSWGTSSTIPVRPKY